MFGLLLLLVSPFFFFFGAIRTGERGVMGSSKRKLDVMWRGRRVSDRGKESRNGSGDAAGMSDELHIG